jgi:hypothetical protein
MIVRRLKEDKYNIALHFLEKKLGRSYTINNPDEDYRFMCPKCRHKNAKLVVTFKNKDYPNGCYHCWTCNDSGISIYQLFYQLYPRHHPVFDELFEISKDEILVAPKNDIRNSLLNKLNKSDEEQISDILAIPPEYIKYKNLSSSHIHSYNFNYLSDYLSKRGITQEDIVKYDLHFNLDNNSIVFPSYDSNGILNHFLTHFVIYKKYSLAQVKKESVIWNELFINWNKPIVLVEGTYDAITVGDNCIPLLGSSITERFSLFKSICRHKTPVILGLDMDVPQEYKCSIAVLFQKNGVDVSVVDWIGKDANESGKDKIKQILKDKKQFNWQQTILKKKLIR